MLEVLITVVRPNELDEKVATLQVVKELRSVLYSQLLAIQNIRVIDMLRYGKESTHIANNSII